MIEEPAIVKQIREVAREHGWAIGVHGSLVRDIDLIGIPWTNEASTPEVLVQAIVRVTGYTRHGVSVGHPRPGGRRSALLVHADASFEHTDKGAWTPPAIDLSLMPSFVHTLAFIQGTALPVGKETT